MKKSISNKLVMLCCLLVLFSCKAKKKLVAERKADTTAVSTDTATSTVAKTTSAATTIDNLKLEKLKTIRSKQVDFNTFSGKAQAKLDINGDSHDVTMNVRIKKDHQIWVSITAVLGIEVARALITPDSIKLMNKLEATYLKKPFSYVYTYTSRQINYKTLESLLIGNAVPELINDGAALKPGNGNIEVSGNLQELVYKLILGPDLRVSQTNMSNSLAGQSLQVDNSMFVQTSNRVLPSQININSVSQQKKIQVNLHYNKADFDLPVDFPYAVPGRFTMLN
ncbi:DUF4292 domain-containing protein [Mucilaginibacter paludis]|nr:DUF4292 domain-containing protein [Mucilaginibacter paludis]